MVSSRAALRLSDISDTGWQGVPLSDGARVEGTCKHSEGLLVGTNDDHL